MTSPTDIETTELPAAIGRFLAAHAARDVDTASQALAPEAVVVDQDRTYRGPDDVLDFLRTAGSEFRYTTTLVGWERVDDHRWVVRNRLEGDFPGGTADLRYRFTLASDRIVELVIAG